MTKKFITLSVAILMAASVTSCKCDKNAGGEGNIISKAAAGTVGAVGAVGGAIGAGLSNAVDGVSDAVDGTLDASGNFLRNVGNMFDITLPSGLSFNVGEKSGEGTLYKRISDDSYTISDDAASEWFTLNDVFFKSGSASNLTDSSMKQVNNIVSILKEFPNATIKIGGYTDTDGDAANNQVLSEKRAQQVANLITTQGIDDNRVSAEGFGEKHPVCLANDTDTCKSQNRRVDIRLTGK